MFLPTKSTKSSEDVDLENEGQMPKQQLPSIQEMFEEPPSFAFPSGPLYARPFEPRHPAPPALPALCVRDHSNTKAQSNEQHPSLKVSIVGSPSNDISPINDQQHLEVAHPLHLPGKQNISFLDLSMSFDVHKLMNEDYFEQIKTISAQSLAFVRYHSAMTRSTHNERSPPVPTILELNSVLIQERQKHDALIHIWNELVRFNQEQASAQRVSRTAAHTADRTGRALCSSLSKQSKTHRVLKRRNQGHGDEALRCHSCNRSETPEWRRGPDGARTLCNACGLHYAKLSRRMGNSSKPNNAPGPEP